MTLLEEIKKLVEQGMEVRVLRQIQVLIRCDDRNVDFQCDPVDIQCHVSSELEDQTMSVHLDSDDVLNLDVTRSDLTTNQDTPISIVVDLSKANVVAEGDSRGLYLKVTPEGQVQEIVLNAGQFMVKVHN